MMRFFLAPVRILQEQPAHPSFATSWCRVCILGQWGESWGCFRSNGEMTLCDSSVKLWAYCPAVSLRQYTCVGSSNEAKSWQLNWVCRQSLQLNPSTFPLLTSLELYVPSSIHSYLVNLNFLFFSFRGFYWNQCPFKMMKRRDEFELFK